MLKLAIILEIFCLSFAAQVYRFDQTSTFEEEWAFFKNKHGIKTCLKSTKGSYIGRVSEVVEQ